MSLYYDMNCSEMFIKKNGINTAEYEVCSVNGI